MFANSLSGHLIFIAGEMVACAAGANFTPHIITVATGEVWLAYIIYFSFLYCKFCVSNQDICLLLLLLKLLFYNLESP